MGERSLSQENRESNNCYRSATSFGGVASLSIVGGVTSKPENRERRVEWERGPAIARKVVRYDERQAWIWGQKRKGIGR